jgi:hypothetical protein
MANDRQKVQVYSRESGGKVAETLVETAASVATADPGDGRKLYHLGTLKSCPFFNVSAGGVCFHRETEIVSFDEATRSTRRSPRAGGYLFLSDDEVAKIKASVDKKFVRWHDAKRTKGSIVTSDSPRYRRFPADEPLAKYLYFREAELSEIRPVTATEAVYAPMGG